MAQVLEQVRMDGREVVVGSVVDLGAALESLDEELKKVAGTVEACQNCRHWDDRWFEIVNPGMGKCWFVKAGQPGIVIMQPASARLFTPATFGCRGFEEKE